jgi:glucan phosphoethanolaminetransferase (alkaline phosphatase superfamily)
MYSPKTESERKVILAILAVSGFILLVIAIFYLLNPRDIVGDSLVNTSSGTPEEFPPDNLFPFYVKPVTMMCVAAVIFAFCFFSLIKEPISRIPRSVRTFLLLVSILGLAISVYETLFNFILWGSLLVSHPDPDTIVNAYPVSSYKVNLVFATKSFVALLFVTYFGYETFKVSLESSTA